MFGLLVAGFNTSLFIGAVYVVWEILVSLC